ncbi:MAG: type II secretion system F family protein, partial [Candidatus Binataceae bacterium]
VSGVVDADNARTARGKLRTQGIFPTDLTEESRARAATSLLERMPFRRRGLPASELSLVSRQLSSLLGAGVQLVDALGALSEQTARPAIKQMLAKIRERVREGSSLADALAAHKEVFTDLYIGMVRAGEHAGALETVLDRLAEYSERQAEFTAKVRGALTYPAIMMVLGAGIMSFLVGYVVPQVATIFESTRVALPLATRILIALASFVTTYYLALLIFGVGGVAAVLFGFSTPRGRRFYDRMVLRTPYLGTTITRIICARFARTLATLLSSGVQLLAALDSVKGVVNNSLLADAVQKSRESIREGHGMGHTLQQSGLFPPLLIEMIKVGERSGELEHMLERVADNYEREVALSLNQVTTLLEPAMTIMMAVIIIFMMLAVRLPIFQRNQLMK